MISITPHHPSQLLQEKRQSQRAAQPPSSFAEIRPFVSQELPEEYSKLWIQGEYRASDSRAVAVVGSRACTSEGAQSAYELSTELAQAGVCIVSGLALGIDGFAHRAALKAGGRTICVLGTGLDIVRPFKNRHLYQEIIQSGAAFSPFPPGFTGYRDGRNYLQRNAWIARLSRVLVVAEAKPRSGSLSAARSALRQGRSVGLAASLVQSQAWAEEFSQQCGVFVVQSAEDVLKRVGS